MPIFWTVTSSEESGPDLPDVSGLCEAGPLGVIVRRQQGLSVRGSSQCRRHRRRRYDSKVLIEEVVVGSEVGCAIFGNGD